MPEVRKIEKLEIRKSRNSGFRKFGKSEIWNIGKTEIQEMGKSERKGFLKNKQITDISVCCFFTLQFFLPPKFFHPQIFSFFFNI